MKATDKAVIYQSIGAARAGGARLARRVAIYVKRMGWVERTSPNRDYDSPYPFRALRTIPASAFKGFFASTVVASAVLAMSTSDVFTYQKLIV